MDSTLFSGATPLLLFLAKATVVLLAALIGALTLRRSTAGARHLVWLAALVGVLALPLLARIPALQIGVLPVATPIATSEQIVAPVAPVAPVASRSAVEVPRIAPKLADNSNADEALVESSPLADNPLVANRESLFTTLAVVWAGIALSLLGWLIFGALQVRRIVAKGIELTSPDWTTPLCEVADRLDLEQPPRLVISDRIEMAFACRALSPTIVLPAAAESWTDDRRRAVLFHELAHVKRLDLLGHTLGRVACALYWFHPLVWTAAKHLRAESEKACDDLVLSCGARPSEYAQHLLDMVTSVRNHGAPIMALPMARKKEFEGRMLAILDPAIRRASLGRLQSAAVVATVGALSLTVAAVAPASARQVAPKSDSSRASGSTFTPDTARTRARSVAADAVSDTDPSTADLVKPVAMPAPIASPRFDRDIARLSNDAAKLGVGVASQVLSGIGIKLAGGAHQGVDSARIALLIRVLNTDPDASVRRAAAWGLNEAATPAARAALAHALANDADQEVREMSAWALAENGDEASGTALSNALIHDKSIDVRRTAAWGLGEIGSRQSADVLASAASDSDAEVRQNAIWALGQLDIHIAPAPLINALDDNSSQVREVAAWSLGQIEDTSAVRPIVRAFEKETDNKVKRVYLWALSQIGSAPTSLIEEAMKSSDPELRRHAVSLLAGNGDSWPWPRPRPMPRPNP